MVGIPPVIHPGYTMVGIPLLYTWVHHGGYTLCAEWCLFSCSERENSAQSGALSPCFFGRMRRIVVPFLPVNVVNPEAKSGAISPVLWENP